MKKIIVQKNDVKTFANPYTSMIKVDSMSTMGGGINRLKSLSSKKKNEVLNE